MIEEGIGYLVGKTPFGDPVNLRGGGKKNGLVVDSPGNFFNSYLGFDGDAGALVNLHIGKKRESQGKESKGEVLYGRKLLGVSIVPIWTRCVESYCVPIPVHELLLVRSKFNLAVIFAMILILTYLPQKQKPFAPPHVLKFLAHRQHAATGLPPFFLSARFS